MKKNTFNNLYFYLDTTPSFFIYQNIDGSKDWKYPQLVTPRFIMWWDGAEKIEDSIFVPFEFVLKVEGSPPTEIGYSSSDRTVFTWFQRRKLRKVFKKHFNNALKDRHTKIASYAENSVNKGLSN